MSDNHHFADPTYNSNIHSSAVQNAVNNSLLPQNHMGCEVCAEYNQSQSKSNDELKTVSSTVKAKTRNYEKDAEQQEDIGEKYKKTYTDISSNVVMDDVIKKENDDIFIPI